MTLTLTKHHGLGNDFLVLLDLDDRYADAHAAMAVALCDRRTGVGADGLLRHVEDGAPLEECIDEAIRRTRQFARRQEAWFRRDPRIRWLATAGESVALTESVLRDWRA